MYRNFFKKRFYLAKLQEKSNFGVGYKVNLRKSWYYSSFWNAAKNDEKTDIKDISYYILKTVLLDFNRICWIDKLYIKSQLDYLKKREPFIQKM